MKLILVNVENGIDSNGFRRMASHIKSYHPETSSYYFLPGKRKLFQHFFVREHRSTQFSEKAAEALAGADMVGFSSASMLAGVVEEIIAHLRVISPKTFIVWGGSHCIMAPDSAIEHADAVCTGEGEFAFQQFFEAYKNERDYFRTPNFWFRKGADVFKLPFRPLYSNAELSELPILEYADPDEKIFDPDAGFVPMKKHHYVKHNGLMYRTIWSFGCPFRCTYCGNTKYIDNDAAFRKIRHPSVSWMMEELQLVKERHPHIRTFAFTDDSFMALRPEIIEDFCKQYKERFDIQFKVNGVIPNYVQEKKLDMLVDAGMEQVRMGIQSGSERILNFYKRPSPPSRVLSAAKTLNLFKRSMKPPRYDIITDNPIETKADVRDSLQLIYDLPRPFYLNVYSLKVYPNTDLAFQFDELEVQLLKYKENTRYNVLPTFANAMIHLLTVMKPPQWIFQRLLRRALPFKEEKRYYPIFYYTLKMLSHLRRTVRTFWSSGYVNYPGSFAYLLVRLGIVDSWRHVRRLWSPRKKHLPTQPVLPSPVAETNELIQET